MRRAADGLRWDRMCVSAAPEAAVNDADASATRTALGIVYSRYRSMQCARWSETRPSSETPRHLIDRSTIPIGPTVACWSKATALRARVPSRAPG